MRAAQARRWAQRWGSHFINLGNAGHINAEAGYGPLPFAAVWVNTNLKQHTHQQRAEHAVIAETSFAE
jgi:predicted alpha/beta hydrolase family esterase